VLPIAWSGVLANNEMQKRWIEYPLIIKGLGKIKVSKNTSFLHGTSMQFVTKGLKSLKKGS